MIIQLLAVKLLQPLLLKLIRPLLVVLAVFVTPVLAVTSFAAGVLATWLLLRRRGQRRQDELAHVQRELAGQRARAMEAERQLDLLTRQASPTLPYGRGVAAVDGFVRTDALEAEAMAALAQMEAAANVQTPDKLTVETAEDDLTQLKGIGPVYAQRLRANGVTTFARLAETSEDALAAMIQAPAWRRPDFADWTSQARLAAAGDHAGLAEPLPTP